MKRCGNVVDHWLLNNCASSSGWRGNGRNDGRLSNITLIGRVIDSLIVRIKGQHAAVTAEEVKP
jgi:hypothetical protein